MSSSVPQVALRDFFRQIPPFQSLPAAEMEHLLATAKQRQVPKGETIYSEGDRADGVWIVQQGRIEIVKYSCDGRPFAIEMLGPNEFFGTLCRIARNSQDYPCSAVAESDAMVVEVPDRVFHDLYTRYPSVVAGICMACSLRLFAMQIFGCASQEPVQRRIAGVLMQLYRTHGRTIPCTKRELAELAGTSLETAIRIVSSFARKAWVQSTRGHITIHNEEALERLLKPMY